MLQLNGKQKRQFALLIIISLLIGVGVMLNGDKITPIAKAMSDYEVSINLKDELSLKSLNSSPPKAPSDVVINEATYKELLMCPQIGKKSAEKILLERRYGRFTDWRDLKDRANLKSSAISALKEADVRLNGSK